VGEVFPNVMTPMTASLYRLSAARGQARAVLEFGMASRSHVEGQDSVLTGVFGGYLYGNLSLGRVAAARVPAMSVADIDRELFGVSDAPPHRRQRGERSAVGTLRGLRQMTRALLRSDRAATPARAARADIAAWLATLPSTESADDAALVARVGGVRTWIERMMYQLLHVSAMSGITRSVLERLVARFDEPGLVNVLTAGLGTIESARPATELWRLGRTVAASPSLTAQFDEHAADLEQRLRADPAAQGFVGAFDAFLAAHGARGPDEWELASPTWGSDPSIALAAIDKLRHAPADRDPTVTSMVLAADRQRRIAEVRADLGLGHRGLFDRSVRATALFAAEREATKAAFVRALQPSRRALSELARRVDLANDDLFMVTIDELPDLLADPPAFTAEIDQRRQRRDFLQAGAPPFWFEGQLPPPETWPRRIDQAAPDDSPRALHGMGVCPGTASGFARVVIDPADPRDLGPDDVLVAPITDPAWTPLFLAVAAVVVDVGAQQSHAAIVARELGIPAVVSVTGASRTIVDGTRLTVDGDCGIVIVHGRSGS
jgi:rifampicin phosphotransferase